MALCIVNRSSPRLSTCSCEIREITLKEMETGFLEENLYTKTPLPGWADLRHVKSDDLHLVLVLLHLLLWELSSRYPAGHCK